MNTISKIVLNGNSDSNNASREVMEIEEGGNLVLEGYGSGEVSKRVWGDDDYEYWLTIEKEWKDTILLLLAQEQFKGFGDFRDWLDKKGVPNEFQNFV